MKKPTSNKMRLIMSINNYNLENGFNNFLAKY